MTTKITVNNYNSYDQEEIATAMNFKMEELTEALQGFDPSEWAEKFPKSTNTMMDIMDKIIDWTERINAKKSELSK